MNGNGALVEAKDVWFRYPGQHSWLLRGIGAVLYPGEVLAVIGPNGSGKTTLLKILAGLHRPAKGCVCIGGRDLWSLDEDRRLVLRRRAVYVHEEPLMLRGSVLENIASGLILRGVPRDKALEAATVVAEKLGLERYAGVAARSLSRGLQQMVSVARALVLRPQILLLDEPFAHLDREKRGILLRVLEEHVSSGGAVALATHNTYIAARIATRIALVEEGSVEAGGQELLEELAM